MEILRWVLLSLFTTLMGAIAGFGLSTRKVEVLWYHLAALAILTYMVSLSSSFLGHLVGDALSIRLFEITLGLLIIAVGVVIITTKPIYPGSKDLFLFTAAMQLDVWLLGFHYGQRFEGGYGLAFTISLLMLGAIVGGLACGGRRWSNWRIQRLLPYTSGMLIVLYGVLTIL